ncbi:Adhesion G protein-coupled receptor L2 [Trichoplax sp. H2]|nr:Adhesion G protein-coupled receptor L2 [Trichoplax sp. H2]|eukprot:RDD43216.1 Adhesion G protein-coupled receptor L2 [Trichoplax sp. H2]
MSGSVSIGGSENEAGASSESGARDISSTCDTPWVQIEDRCVWLSNSEAKFASADQQCQSLNGHLVMDSPANFHQNLTKYLSIAGIFYTVPIWIGLTDTRGINNLLDYRWKVPPYHYISYNNNYWASEINTSSKSSSDSLSADLASKGISEITMTSIIDSSLQLLTALPIQQLNHSIISLFENLHNTISQSRESSLSLSIYSSKTMLNEQFPLQTIALFTDNFMQSSKSIGNDILEDFFYSDEDSFPSSNFDLFSNSADITYFVTSEDTITDYTVNSNKSSNTWKFTYNPSSPTSNETEHIITASPVKKSTVYHSYYDQKTNEPTPKTPTPKTIKNQVHALNTLLQKNTTSNISLNSAALKNYASNFFFIANNYDAYLSSELENENMIESMINAANILLDPLNAEEWEADSYQDSSHIVDMIGGMENFALKIGQAGLSHTINVVTKNIELEIKVPNEKEVVYNTKLNLGYRSYDWMQVGDPTNQLQRQLIPIVKVLYKEIGLTEDIKTNADISVNTHILSCAIATAETNLSIDYQFSLGHKMQKEELSNVECVYWNFTSKRWLSNGCQVIRSRYSYTSCRCNHLTHFAIMMRVTNATISDKHQQILSILTYIGFGISLVAMMIAFTLFTIFRALRSERFEIHKNLIAALALAQIIHIASMQSDYDAADSIRCKIFAISLHYLYLAAFSWMLVEGINLYFMIIRVFNAGKSMTAIYYGIGWGLPLIVVGVSVAVKFQDYGVNSCWLSITSGLIWAFIGPAIFIISFNTIILLMVVRIVLHSATAKVTGNATDAGRLEITNIWSSTKASVILLPLLGLTWVFGVLSFDEDTIAFSYLFVIFNSLQGLFIFLFHCVFNGEVRAKLKSFRQKNATNSHLNSSVWKANSRKKRKTNPSSILKSSDNDDIRIANQSRATAIKSTMSTDITVQNAVALPYCPEEYIQKALFSHEVERS